MNKRGDGGFLGLSWGELIKIVLAIAFIIILLSIIFSSLGLFLDTDEKVMRSNFDTLTAAIDKALADRKAYFLSPQPTPIFFPDGAFDDYFIVAYNKDKTDSLYPDHPGKTLKRPTMCGGACICLYDDSEALGGSIDKRDKGVLACKNYYNVDKFTWMAYDPPSKYVLFRRFQGDFYDPDVPDELKRGPGVPVFGQLFWDTNKGMDDAKELRRFMIERATTSVVAAQGKGMVYVNIALYPSDNAPVIKKYEDGFKERRVYMEQQAPPSGQQLADQVKNAVIGDYMNDPTKPGPAKADLITMLGNVNMFLKSAKADDPQIPVMYYYQARLSLLLNTHPDQSPKEFAETAASVRYLADNRSKPGFKELDWNDIGFLNDTKSLYTNQMSPADYATAWADDGEALSKLADYSLYLFKERGDGMHADQALAELLTVLATPGASSVSPPINDYLTAKAYFIECLIQKGIDIDNAKHMKENINVRYASQTEWKNRVNTECNP